MMLKRDLAHHRPLPKGKNKKVSRLMKDELGGKIMTEFAILRPKTYSYLIDHDNRDLNVNHTLYILQKSIRLH